MNLLTRTLKVLFDWKTKNVSDDLSKRSTHFDTVTYGVRDLWTKKDRGTTKAPLDADLPAHDVLIVRLTKL